MTDGFSCTIEGRPVPAVRMTQRSKWANPQAQRYLAWKQKVGWTAKEWGAEPAEGRLQVRLWFYLSKRGRADIDNLAKGIMDGLNGICFHDDTQVDELIVRIRTGCTDEHVDLEVRKIA
jgi:crossover junction endodeoxyribonuclease RusA